MTWIVALCGVLLAAVGAASIALGINYIEIERGMTEVIAGTVALTGGLILGALALLMARLGPLLAATTARVTEPVKPGEPVAAALPQVSVAAPSPPPVEPSSAERYAEPALTGDPHQAAVEEVPRPSRFPPLFPSAPLAETVHPKEGAAHEELAPTSPPARATPAPAPMRSAPPPPKQAVPPASAPPPAQREREMAPVMTFETGPEPLQPKVADDFDWLDSAIAEAAGPIAAPRPATPALEMPVTREPETVAVPPDAPTVVGRYQAGAATYVMFSDGSIEVDTETGVHRFASMADLKTFIDHQDG